MPGFLLSAAFAQVNMVCTRPLGGLLEERIHAIELAERDMHVAEGSEDANVRLKGVEGRDRDLDVDHGLCGEPGHCRGPHVLDAQRETTKRASDLTSLRFEHVGPCGIVWDERDQVTHQSRVARAAPL